GQPNPPAGRAGTLIEPGVNPLPRQPAGQPHQAVERSSTVIETEEDVRQALLSGLKGRPEVPVSLPAAAPAPPAQQQPAPPPIAARSASPFRPTARPPIALLTVFDDGRIDGE